MQELLLLINDVLIRKNSSEVLSETRFKSLSNSKFNCIKPYQRKQQNSRKQKLITIIHIEFEQLQNQFSQRQNNKRQLDQELSILQEQRKQVEAEKNKLQAQIQTLEIEQTQWNQLISLTKSESQNAEANLKSLKAELLQLQAQITQPQKQASDSEVVKSEEQKQEEEKQDDPKLPSEWEEFMWELSEYEIQILKSLAEEDNPVETIKRISDEQIKMPELLIETINERALETIGDLIIEPGSSPPMIADDDYLTTLKQMLKVYEDLAK